ncbi:MAG: CCDC90 family protein [Burkholderiales bacterium]|jgi:F0F1-type ATP synthase membrane subunit b/b'|nr:CCDC90 family protein [Burkholderiales bacterium]
MGTPAVELSTQSLVKAGFKYEQADALVRLMDLKMTNLLTQEYLDLALGRFADQVANSISAARKEIVDLRTEVKQEIAELRTEVKDLKRELKDDIKDVRNEMKDLKQELKDDIKDVRNELALGFANIKLDVSERHNKQLLWMAGIIGLALAAARLLFSF